MRSTLCSFRSSFERRKPVSFMEMYLKLGGNEGIVAIQSLTNKSGLQRCEMAGVMLTLRPNR